jgi:hypothetical protein
MIPHGLKENILNFILRKLKIPPLASRMFKISNGISGLNNSTLPTELIPLNSVQLSRGLLNYAMIQSKINPGKIGSIWIYPYWINRQYNPSDISFIPRSHSGLSLNLTHRNWTAVGNPDCNVEPIVDPRGLVTPFPNGWSIDTWLAVDEKTFFPSMSHSCVQKLIEDLPVIETKFEFEGITLNLISFSAKTLLFHRSSITSRNSSAKNCRLILSVRPFNPEGVGIINSILFDNENDKFIINQNENLFFDKRPESIHCSNFELGDAAEFIFRKLNGHNNLLSACSNGLASAMAAFKKTLNAGESFTVQACCSLDKSLNISSFRKETYHTSSIVYWNNLLKESTSISTPDKKINSLVKSSLSTLLMFADGDSITPGPLTYHQFWFRDAAFMLSALDKFGSSNYTAPVIKSFPKHQESSGYFRSQKGEWDSNGQVMWTVYNHYLIERDISLLENLFPSLYLGVKWIHKFRITRKEFSGQPYYGLLQKGISAEHLGHADYYFWDNFWSLGGIKSFIKICNELGKEKEKRYAENLFQGYESDVKRGIDFVRKKYSIKEIPASPLRNIDCGMIGSICASYPLLLFSPNDEKIISSLDTLNTNFFYDGLFFQQFIHSGMNPYLTLHVAHSYLFAGNRKKFWEIFSSVLSKASPTLNYPEAIHPLTGGGVMGDGHHGWAAAEVLSAVRDAFIFENTETNEAVLLQGIPSEWFMGNKIFYIKNSPMTFGLISIFIECLEETITIKINLGRKNEIPSKMQWRIKLPVKLLAVKENEAALPFVSHDDYSEIIMSPRSCCLTLTKSKISFLLFSNQSKP